MSAGVVVVAALLALTAMGVAAVVGIIQGWLDQ